MNIEQFIEKTITRPNMGGLLWESHQEYEERQKQIHYCRICGTLMKPDHYNYVRMSRVVVYRCPACGNSEMFERGE